jgi:putative hydrolase of the HAD superfamily
MIKAVLFDLDGTLHDRDAVVHNLVVNQYATFAHQLPGVTREHFISRALEMDDHGQGDKAVGYQRIVAEWQLQSDLATRLCEHFSFSRQRAREMRLTLASRHETRVDRAPFDRHPVCLRS